jgi:hypothetical protein
MFFCYINSNAAMSVIPLQGYVIINCLAMVHES